MGYLEDTITFVKLKKNITDLNLETWTDLSKVTKQVGGRVGTQICLCDSEAKARVTWVTLHYDICKGLCAPDPVIIAEIKLREVFIVTPTKQVEKDGQGLSTVTLHPSVGNQSLLYHFLRAWGCPCLEGVWLPWGKAGGIKGSVLWD